MKPKNLRIVVCPYWIEGRWELRDNTLYISPDLKGRVPKLLHRGEEMNFKEALRKLDKVHRHFTNFYFKRTGEFIKIPKELFVTPLTK